MLSPTMKMDFIFPVKNPRWLCLSRSHTPWIHAEVARRMLDRLTCFKTLPKSYWHVNALLGGLDAQKALQTQLRGATTYLDAISNQQMNALKRALDPNWFYKLLHGVETRFSPPDNPVEMIWCNMQLHEALDPLVWIRKWHAALANRGFVMFSCLGPDSFKELRDLYDQSVWGMPAQSFLDMHEIGDMLLASGFSDPVVDMERIICTYATPELLIADLREAGRNLHPKQFAGLRTPAWLMQFKEDMANPQCIPRAVNGDIPLTLEIVFGYAVKMPESHRFSDVTTISLDSLRQQLRGS